MMTDGSDWQIEMSAQSEQDSDAVNADIESTLQCLCHLRRHRNLLTSPLLRLPTELILKIFVHAIELDDDTPSPLDNDNSWSSDDGSLPSWSSDEGSSWSSDNSDSSFPHDNGSSSSDGGPPQLVFTAICHQLREIGIASSQLWSTVDLGIPRIADLFLKRCKYDPHTLINSQLVVKRRTRSTVSPGKQALWEQLEGRTFNNLRSIAFEAEEIDVTPSHSKYIALLT
jgi:hypothetical protein